jgi:hypothetical protein
MQRHHRLTLAIVLATIILGVNAYVVVNGWSPFEVPDSNLLSTLQVNPASMLTHSIGKSIN